MDIRTWLRGQWDRVGAALLVAAGIVAILLGWIGLSGVGLPAAQIPYVLSGGVLGVVFIGIGATLWMSADLRDEWRKLDRLEELALKLLDRANDAGTEVAADVSGANGSTVGNGPHDGAGRRRPLRAGKPASKQ
jgi:hypothetical protein